jgi:thiol-disulfide isomerase/thioredoxin
MFTRKLLFSVILSVVLLFSGINSLQAAVFKQFTHEIKPVSGKWRGYIMREDGHQIPFKFDIIKSGRKLIIYIDNDTERLLVDNVLQEGDSVFIKMPFFDSRFDLRVKDSLNMYGSYVKNYGDHLVTVPFKAMYDQLNSDAYVAQEEPPSYNISGRWSVLFRGVHDSTLAVGEFKQLGDHVKGTFLTSTGDYRYLEGRVNADTLRLSTFDGGHAYSFESKILNDHVMTGFFYAGAVSVESWVAEKNENAKLPDEFSLTHLKDSAKAFLHFRFNDLNGHIVSLSDPSFKDKVVIIQILGSWCPNCMDETKFLAPWYIKNKSRGVEVVGLAYERTTSFTDAKRLLLPFITRFDVTYPILPTGVTVNDSLRTEKTLPELQAIVGFPTTIIIDKKGMVRKIHTGFNGPGTGEHYLEFQIEFNELVNNLLKEEKDL